VIELMLEAERALAVGLLDQAERYYRQVAASDPKNAIAVVGLARVALERDDQLGAYLFARRALALDPENPMASHLSQRMAEQLRMRGEAVPGEAGPEAGQSAARVAPPGPDATRTRNGPAGSEAPAGPAPVAPPTAPSETPDDTRPGLIGRLLRRRR
jgi:tetratricopeptide (TPR) repeat protein